MNRRAMQGHGEPPEQGLTYSDEGVEPEDDGPYADVADPATGTVRLGATAATPASSTPATGCDTCIFHPAT